MAIPMAIILAGTMLSGIVHGVLDGRWAVSEDLQTQGARLLELPESAGQWKLVEKRDLDPTASMMLKCYGSVLRIYEHEQSELRLSVAVMFGPRGPIAVHTPEVCYDSVGTKQTRATQMETINTTSRKHSFWSVAFAEEPNPDPSIEVWYAWSEGGAWQAGKYPRLWLTDSLYKLQLAGPVANDTSQPCRDFLEEFIPQLESLLQ